MATLEIPIDITAEKFKQSVILDSVLYKFQFTFNTRMDNWIMDILDGNDIPLLVGIPLQTNVYLTKDFHHLSIPKGVFLTLDTEGLQKNPGEDDFGDRVKLIYEEAV